MLWTASFKVVTSWSEAPDFIIPNKIYRNLALRQLSAIKKVFKCLSKSGPSFSETSSDSSVWG